MWPQVLKAVIFAALLLMANANGGFFWPFVFIAAAAYMYFQPLFEWKKFIYSFLILLFYSWGSISFFSNGLAATAAAIVFSLAFFVLLGVKNFSFLKRDNKLNVLCGFIYFLISAVFFAADKTGGFGFIFYFMISFAAFYGALKEFLDFFHPDFPKTRKSLIIAGSAFLIMELASAISFLPLGFLNASALVLLFVFILEDFISYHLKGTMNRQAILNNVTILIVAMIFIFAASKWTL